MAKHKAVSPTPSPAVKRAAQDLRKGDPNAGLALAEVKNVERLQQQNEQLRKQKNCAPQEKPKKSDQPKKRK